MTPFSLITHVRHAVWSPRGCITQPPSLVFTLFSFLESDDRHVASLLLLIHRCPYFTLFSFMARVPVTPDNVAQVHQALDVPVAPVQAPQGNQPAQVQVQAPPIERLAADMMGILFSGIRLFYCDFCKLVTSL